MTASGEQQDRRARGVGWRVRVDDGAHRPRVHPSVAWAAAWGWRLLVLGAVGWYTLQIASKLLLVLLPVIVALLLATLLEPPVGWLARHGWPRLLATWVTILAVALLLGGIGYGLGLRVAGQFDDLARHAGRGVGQVENWLLNGPLDLSERQLSNYAEQLRDQLQLGGERLTQSLVSGTRLVGEFLAGVLLTLVLTFFFIKDGPGMWAWFLGVLGPGRAPGAQALGGRVWDTLGGYLRGTALVGLVDAVAIGAGLLVLGVPLVVPLTVITFLGAFFPLVGATVSGALAALVALVSDGVPAALIVVALTVAVQQVEGDVVSPLVLGRAVRLHPVVILVALTAGGLVAGLVGAFLAVPLVAVGAAVGNELRSGWPPGDRDQEQRDQDREDVGNGRAEPGEVGGDRPGAVAGDSGAGRPGRKAGS